MPEFSLSVCAFDVFESMFYAQEEDWKVILTLGN